VGCDVQHISPGENAYIGAETDTAEREQEWIERFYRIWVLKECYLKAKGLSVLDMRAAPSFADRDGLVKKAPVPFSFFLYELDCAGGRYLLAVCRETGLQAAAPLPEIRRYSPSPVLKQLAVIEGVSTRISV
jgi:phosphopantetheinyl transferase